MTEPLEILTRRIDRVEQILPTLATKDDLQRAIEPLATKEELRRAIEPLATKEELRRAIEPLATKEELRLAIADAVAPLATRQELAGQVAELRQEIREEGDRSRRHASVLFEQGRSDIQLLAEHLSSVMTKLFKG